MTIHSIGIKYFKSDGIILKNNIGYSQQRTINLGLRKSKQRNKQEYVKYLFHSSINENSKILKTKTGDYLSIISRWVLEAGLEPARPKEHRILSPACLPIPPLEQVMRGASEGIRTLDPHLGKVMLYPWATLAINPLYNRGCKYKYFSLTTKQKEKNLGSD